MSYSINRLVANLRDLCAERVLDEKWLIAPSRRVGMQWLDAVARSGQPVLNFRVKTLRGLAIELAAPVMKERGLQLVSRKQAEVLADRAFGHVAERSGRGYLTRLAPSPGLTETLSRAIHDARLAGLRASDLDPSRFEVEEKGLEIAAMLAFYEEWLTERGLVDYPLAVRLAVERLEGDKALPSVEALVVTSGDVVYELAGLELAFWEAIPRSRTFVLPSDAPGEPDAGRDDNLALLSYLDEVAGAPAPGSSDGTVGFFRAVGEVNEVREVLRRCVESGIPFDKVELLYTDRSTYVPLIFEVFCSLEPEDPSSIPVAFYEGVPSIYSRPARALRGWLFWVSGGYPQSALVDMVSEGLLEIGIASKDGYSFARLGSITRSLPVGGGAERYLPAMDRELASLARALETGQSLPGPEDEEETPDEREKRLARLKERAAGLESIRELVAGLIGGLPGAGASQADYLASALSFIERFTRSRSQFDNYCRKKIVEEITEMAGCLRDGDVDGFDPAAWLSGLPASTYVEGKGPQPGRLYAAPLGSGGHSGRPHTFILGLDDTRFPGTGGQDPLLLDGERESISEHLPTGAERLARRVRDFSRLLARLRGNVILGYCCRSLSDDREMFASPVVLSAYRILDKRDGDQTDLARWIGDPVSFAPLSPERCIDVTEWWLSRTCGEAEIENIEGLIAIVYPHLGRGFKARDARAGDLFTEYDGYVPEAGGQCDPTAPDGPALSSARLETLARCPLEFFFKYVLEVRPLEEYHIDPSAWLDSSQKGSLLHAAFRTFMSDLSAEGHVPEAARDAGRLAKVIDAEIDGWKALHPPPSAPVFEREQRELHLAGRIFLLEEQTYCRGVLPRYFEVAVGMQPEAEGTALDSDEPVEILLPNGLGVRLLGRIDRVDQVDDGEGACYIVWDYKTGRNYGLKATDPFQQGRHVQNAVYIELVNARLSEVHPGARAVRFGYFFPGITEHGERVSWDADELEAAGPLLELLCGMMAKGCFPFTDNPSDDLRISDYKPAFGDAAAAAAGIARKLDNPRNTVLEPFRCLRGYQVAQGFTGELVDEQEAP